MTNDTSKKDRVVTNIDNAPPEALPITLASVSELPQMMKADVDQVVTRAVMELDTFSRVPETIENDEIYERATTLATQLKKVFDDGDTRRTKHKAPYLAATRLIDDTFKLITPGPNGKERNLKKELEAAHASLKRRLSDYDTRKYLKEQAEREAEQQRIAEAAAKDGIEMTTGDAASVLPTTVRSAHGGQAVRKVVTEWSVEDESLLPRSVLSVDPAKVEKMIADGAKAIPGIRIGVKVETHVKR